MQEIRCVATVTLSVSVLPPADTLLRLGELRHVYQAPSVCPADEMGFLTLM